MLMEPLVSSLTPGITMSKLATSSGFHHEHPGLVSCTVSVAYYWPDTCTLVQQQCATASCKRMQQVQCYPHVIRLPICFYPELFFL